jgi:hypothetical protein
MSKSEILYIFQKVVCDETSTIWDSANNYTHWISCATLTSILSTSCSLPHPCSCRRLPEQAHARRIAPPRPSHSTTTTTSAVGLRYTPLQGAASSPTASTASPRLACAPSWVSWPVRHRGPYALHVAGSFRRIFYFILALLILNFKNNPPELNSKK